MEKIREQRRGEQTGSTININISMISPNEDRDQGGDKDEDGDKARDEHEYTHKY